MKDMEQAITRLANSMTADYALWQINRINPMSESQNQAKLAEYEETLEFEYGRKYIKVINKRSCAGFIVNVDNDPKFKRGDMLKAANWNSPTRNFARGNIFNKADVLEVRWTGIN